MNNIQSIYTKCFKAGTALLGALSGLFGGFDALLKALMLCMLVDYVSGVLCAIAGKSRKSADGKLSSAQGAKGIYKKILIMLSVLIAATLDQSLGQNNVFRNAACVFYISNELISFIENLNTMGVPFPERVKKAIGQLQEK